MFNGYVGERRKIALTRERNEENGELKVVGYFVMAK
jgi:hypothetical protein